MEIKISIKSVKMDFWGFLLTTCIKNVHIIFREKFGKTNFCEDYYIRIISVMIFCDR